MTSLYNRATPAQQRALRIIEGAIKNAADAHPEIVVSPRHRRSIAKRAVGLLAATDWPQAVSARASERPRLTDRTERQATSSRASRRRQASAASGVGKLNTDDEAAGSTMQSPPLLGLAERHLWKCLGPLSRNDPEAYEAALILVALLGRRRKASA